MGDSVQPDLETLLTYLRSRLGPILIGAMCGTEGPAPLDLWLTRPPDIETEGKLRIGYDATKAICEREGAPLARAWLMGMNPQLDNGNPLTEIGKGNGRNVLIAVRVHLQDPMLT